MSGVIFYFLYVVDAQYAEVSVGNSSSTVKESIAAALLCSP